MPTIRTFYSREPDFPATDQHPEAQRYHFDGVWIDCVGDLTEADWRAYQLTQARQQAAGEIARLAELRRSTITSASAGKQGAYLLKYELVLRAEANDATARNLLTAEATARGLTYEQLRDLVATKRSAWETAAMHIETVEAASKAAVASAADRDAVAAAVATAGQLFSEIGG